MFGLSTSAIFTLLKASAVAIVIGILVHKGMMIERGRWERAVAAKNKEIAALKKDTTDKLAKAESERDVAFLEANKAMETLLRTAMTPNVCILPDDLVKKANRIK